MAAGHLMKTPFAAAADPGQNHQQASLLLSEVLKLEAPAAPVIAASAEGEEGRRAPTVPSAQWTMKTLGCVCVLRTFPLLAAVLVAAAIRSASAGNG